MTHYDYKVVPAPRRAKKVRGLKGTEELFAHTLTEAINEVARQGWEYVRAERLPAEGPGGWFRGPTAGEQTVLVFRRQRETLGPRIAATHDAEPDEAWRPAPAEPAPSRVVRPDPAPRHREPRIEPLPASESVDSFPTPLRPPPRLGPTDQG